MLTITYNVGTVRARLESGYYKKIDDAANDVRLIWTNCMLYNTDGSEYYHLADRFAQAFESAYTALRKLDDSNNDSSRIPTIDEKMILSYDIFKIDNKEMAKVLTMIEVDCPEALSRKNSSDNDILVNFDALTPTCFHEVNKFVQSCVISNVAGKKKPADKPAAEAKVPGPGHGKVGRPPKSKNPVV